MADQFPQGAALIFGGSGGIGQGVCDAFARAGSAVAIAYHSKRDVAEARCREIEAAGGRATAHQLDARDEDSMRAAFDAVVAAHGRVHTIVWGAGPLVDQVLIAEMTQAQWRRALEIEVFGLFTATKVAIPHFREQGGGSFVHLGSAGDRWWPAMDGLSVAPKAANEALIRGLAKEEGKHNIRANSVLVGVIEAGMFLELQKQGVFDEAWTRDVHGKLCLPRWGKPEDIGAAAVFLASNAANYITGQQLSVSGGFGV
ncbi:SDR family NAD(P)-dependent oxidoreductase [Sphingomonas jatrophae]|uniref:NAD(P)-dependent dehydrogenase, short-chain alcohol dehydrogenase family n=1 Tax=Sphingomonas jatrophae TaxID=1166337 RepID=A0A1I6KFM9_9SPHN|nr:SDR family oxidoreductase [Sphingomonas jatrophae]SFR90055.1 NAD(P)-dependent dehydrogenase, short-chain alcohol dehydrogenase family [Sphingomonas jatrophae]